MSVPYILVIGATREKQMAVIRCLADMHGGAKKWRNSTFEALCFCNDGSFIKTVGVNHIRGYQATDVWIEKMPLDGDTIWELLHCVSYKKDHIHLFEELL